MMKMRILSDSMNDSGNYISRIEDKLEEDEIEDESKKTSKKVEITLITIWKDTRSLLEKFKTK